MGAVISVFNFRGCTTCYNLGAVAGALIIFGGERF